MVKYEKTFYFLVRLVDINTSLEVCTYIQPNYLFAISIHPRFNSNSNRRTFRRFLLIEGQRESIIISDAIPGEPQALLSASTQRFSPGFSIENPRPEIMANFILAVKGIKGFNKVDYLPLEKGLEQGLPCPTVRLKRTNGCWFVFHFDNIQIQAEQIESKQCCTIYGHTLNIFHFYKWILRKLVDNIFINSYCKCMNIFVNNWTCTKHMYIFLNSFEIWS